MRVLVVEDQKKTASFIRKALEAEGFIVDVCHNGENAFAAATATAFDGIVLDIMLPGSDGLNVLRRLREQKDRTPVLLLSARGEVNELGSTRRTSWISMMDSLASGRTTGSMNCRDLDALLRISASFAVGSKKVLRSSASATHGSGSSKLCFVRS